MAIATTPLSQHAMIDTNVFVYTLYPAYPQYQEAFGQAGRKSYRGAPVESAVRFVDTTFTVVGTGALPGNRSEDDALQRRSPQGSLESRDAMAPAPTLLSEREATRSGLSLRH